jgi:hypothetical protein
MAVKEIRIRSDNIINELMLNRYPKYKARKKSFFKKLFNKNKMEDKRNV